MYADAGDTSKHQEHNRELELRLRSLVELVGSIELVMKSNCWTFFISVTTGRCHNHVRTPDLTQL